MDYLQSFFFGSFLAFIFVSYEIIKGKRPKMDLAFFLVAFLLSGSVVERLI